MTNSVVAYTGNDILINGVPLNSIDSSGVLWTVSDLDGWHGLPEAALPDDPMSALEDGSVAHAGRYLTRDIKLAGNILPGGSTLTGPEFVVAARNALNVLVSRIRTDSILQVNEDPPQIAYVRITDRVLTKFSQSNDVLTFEIQLRASDPRKYSLEEHEEQTSPRSPSTGRTYDKTYYYTYGTETAKSGLVNAYNYGNYGTDAKLVITGPATNPRVEHAGTGEFLEFSVTLTESEYLEIDLAMHTVLLNGTENYRKVLTPASRWFSLGVGDNYLLFTSTQNPAAQEYRRERINLIKNPTASKGSTSGWSSREPGRTITIKPDPDSGFILPIPSTSDNWGATLDVSARPSVVPGAVYAFSLDIRTFPFSAAPYRAYNATASLNFYNLGGSLIESHEGGLVSFSTTRASRLKVSAKAPSGAATVGVVFGKSSTFPITEPLIQPSSILFNKLLLERVYLDEEISRNKSTNPNLTASMSGWSNNSGLPISRLNDDPFNTLKAQTDGTKNTQRTDVFIRSAIAEKTRFGIVYSLTENLNPGTEYAVSLDTKSDIDQYMAINVAFYDSMSNAISGATVDLYAVGQGVLTPANIWTRVGTTVVVPDGAVSAKFYLVPSDGVEYGRNIVRNPSFEVTNFGESLYEIATPAFSKKPERTQYLNLSDINYVTFPDGSQIFGWSAGNAGAGGVVSLTQSPTGGALNVVSSATSGVKKTWTTGASSPGTVTNVGVSFSLPVSAFSPTGRISTRAWVTPNQTSKHALIVSLLDDSSNVIAVSGGASVQFSANVGGWLILNDVALVPNTAIIQLTIGPVASGDFSATTGASFVVGGLGITPGAYDSLTEFGAPSISGSFLNPYVWVDGLTTSPLRSWVVHAPAQGKIYRKNEAVVSRPMSSNPYWQFYTATSNTASAAYITNEPGPTDQLGFVRYTVTSLSGGGNNGVEYTTPVSGLNIKPGETYRARMWVRVNNGANGYVTTPGFISASFMSGASIVGSPTTAQAQVTLTPGVWTEFVTSITNPLSGSTTYTGVHIRVWQTATGWVPVGGSIDATCAMVESPVITHERINHAIDPSFESGTIAASGVNASLASSTAWAYSGTRSMSVTPTGPSNDSYAVLPLDATCLNSMRYIPRNTYWRLQAIVNRPGALSGALNSSSGTFRIKYTDSLGQVKYISGTSLGASAGTFSTSLFIESGSIPDGSIVNEIQLVNGASVDAGGTQNVTRFDNILIEQVIGSPLTSLGVYFDGSTVSSEQDIYSWTGPQYLSASRYIHKETASGKRYFDGDTPAVSVISRNIVKSPTVSGAKPVGWVGGISGATSGTASGIVYSPTSPGPEGKTLGVVQVALTSASLLSATPSATDIVKIQRSQISVVPGNVYSAGLWMYGRKEITTVLKLSWYNLAGGLISTVYGAPKAGLLAWDFHKIENVTAPAGASSAELSMAVYSNGTIVGGSTSVFFTQAIVVPGSTLTTYFDGSTTDAAYTSYWLGAINNSESVQTLPSDMRNSWTNASGGSSVQWVSTDSVPLGNLSAVVSLSDTISGYIHGKSYRILSTHSSVPSYVDIPINAPELPTNVDNSYKVYARIVITQSQSTTATFSRRIAVLTIENNITTVNDISAQVPNIPGTYEVEFNTSKLPSKIAGLRVYGGNSLGDSDIYLVGYAVVADSYHGSAPHINPDLGHDFIRLVGTEADVAIAGGSGTVTISKNIYPNPNSEATVDIVDTSSRVNYIPDPIGTRAFSVSGNFNSKDWRLEDSGAYTSINVRPTGGILVGLTAFTSGSGMLRNGSFKLNLPVSDITGEPISKIYTASALVSGLEVLGEMFAYTLLTDSDGNTYSGTVFSGGQSQVAKKAGRVYVTFVDDVKVPENVDIVSKEIHTYVVLSTLTMLQSDTILVTQALIEDGSQQGTYFDGGTQSTPSQTFVWNGTPNNSRSTVETVTKVERENLLLGNINTVQTTYTPVSSVPAGLISPSGYVPGMPGWVNNASISGITVFEYGNTTTTPVSAFAPKVEPGAWYTYQFKFNVAHSDFGRVFIVGPILTGWTESLVNAGSIDATYTDTPGGGSLVFKVPNNVVYVTPSLSLLLTGAASPSGTLFVQSPISILEKTVNIERMFNGDRPENLPTLDARSEYVSTYWTGASGQSTSVLAATDKTVLHTNYALNGLPASGLPGWSYTYTGSGSIPAGGPVWENYQGPNTVSNVASVSFEDLTGVGFVQGGWVYTQPYRGQAPDQFTAAMSVYVDQFYGSSSGNVTTYVELRKGSTVVATSTPVVKSLSPKKWEKIVSNTVSATGIDQYDSIRIYTLFDREIVKSYATQAILEAGSTVGDWFDINNPINFAIRTNLVPATKEIVPIAGFPANNSPSVRVESNLISDSGPYNDPALFTPYSAWDSISTPTGNEDVGNFTNYGGGPKGSTSPYVSYSFPVSSITASPGVYGYSVTAAAIPTKPITQEAIYLRPSAPCTVVVTSEHQTSANAVVIARSVRVLLVANEWQRIVVQTPANTSGTISKMKFFVRILSTVPGWGDSVTLDASSVSYHLTSISGYTSNTSFVGGYINSYTPTDKTLKVTPQSDMSKSVYGSSRLLAPIRINLVPDAVPQYVSMASNSSSAVSASRWASVGGYGTGSVGVSGIDYMPALGTNAVFKSWSSLGPSGPSGAGMGPRIPVVASSYYSFMFTAWATESVGTETMWVDWYNSSNTFLSRTTYGSQFALSTPDGAPVTQKWEQILSPGSAAYGVFSVGHLANSPISSSYVMAMTNVRISPTRYIDGYFDATSSKPQLGDIGYMFGGPGEQAGRVVEFGTASPNYLPANVDTSVTITDTIDDEAEIRITGLGWTNTTYAKISEEIPDQAGILKPGKTYTISAYGRIDTTNETVSALESSNAFRIVVTHSSGTVRSNPIDADGSRVSVTVTIPSNSTENSIQLWCGLPGGVGSVYWSRVLIEETSVAKEYFNGDTYSEPVSGFRSSWVGIPGKSRSIIQLENSGTTATKELERNVMLGTRVYGVSGAPGTNVFQFPVSDNEVWPSFNINATSSIDARLAMTSDYDNAVAFAELLPTEPLMAGKTYTVAAVVLQTSIQGTVDSMSRRIVIRYRLLSNPAVYTYQSTIQAPNTTGRYQLAGTFTIPTDAYEISVLLWSGPRLSSEIVFWEDIIIAPGEYFITNFNGDAEVPASREGQYLEWTGEEGKSSTRLYGLAPGSVYSRGTVAYMAQDWSVAGQYSVKVVPIDSSEQGYIVPRVNTDDIPETYNHVQIVADVYLPVTPVTPTHPYAYGLVWVDPLGNETLLGQADPVAGTYRISAIVPSTSALGEIRLYHGGLASDENIVQWDNVALIYGNWTSGYFDGDTTDEEFIQYTWWGRRYRNTSHAASIGTGILWPEDAKYLRADHLRISETSATNSSVFFDGRNTADSESVYYFDGTDDLSVSVQHGTLQPAFDGYFDGDFANATWNGTPGNSTSIMYEKPEVPETTMHVTYRDAWID